MDDAKEYVAQAREKGLSDDQIKQMLIDSGWTVAQARAVLYDLKIPVAPQLRIRQDSPAAAQLPVQATSASTNSIGALEAAFQHVLLWVFTATTTVMFGVVLRSVSDV